MWRVPLSRRQLDDAGLTALFLLCGVGLYLAGLNKIGGLSVVGVPTWFSLVTLSVAAAFQLTRSTRTALTLTATTVVLVVDVVTVSSIGVWLVFSDTVYAACVYGGARLVRTLHVIVVLVCAGGLTLAAIETGTADWRPLFLVSLWLIAFVASPLAYGHAVREHRNALAAERERAAALAQLAERERSEAVADERHRLARELHDVIAGRLSAIAMHSAAALEYPTNPVLTDKVLRSIRESSVDALREMRGMIACWPRTPQTCRRPTKRPPCVGSTGWSTPSSNPAPRSNCAAHQSLWIRHATPIRWRYRRWWTSPPTASSPNRSTTLSGTHPVNPSASR